MVNITHCFGLELGDFGILDNVYSIDEFLSRARTIGAERNSKLIAADQRNPFLERNRIVGDAFEVFGEFLFKHKSTDDRFLISGYRRPEKDNGVDAICVHSGPLSDPKNGSQVLIQIKCYQEFVDNKILTLTGKELDTFQAECFHMLMEQFPDGNVLTGWPRMIVLTSAKGINSYTDKTKYRSRVVCLGIDEIRQLTCSPEFWDAFRAAV